MILKNHAFICEHTHGDNVTKMYKKCLFLLCAVFVLEVKSDCDGYIDCFSSFFNNFFSKTDSDVEYLNVTSDNLPENFVEVKNVQINELNKVLSEITSFLQQDITKQLKTQSQDAIFENVNPKTKVYVKTFTYGDTDSPLPNFENIELLETVTEYNEKAVTVHEFEDLLFKATPQTTTKSAEIKKIEAQKDISENEIPQSDDILSYYDIIDDNSTDYPIIDYVELYKDTTNEENVYNPTEVPVVDDIRDHIQEKVVEYVDHMEKFMEEINNAAAVSEMTTVFPWVTTIFVKNESLSNQFEYTCDGALLSTRRLITAARCVMSKNSTVPPEDILVIVGKRSLLSMADQEQTVKIKQITIHENFTREDGRIENDLALLEFEEPITFNELTQPAEFGNDTKSADKAFTFAWNLQGQLVTVNLEKKEAQTCNHGLTGENTFCAAYGLNVALCPNYGGIYVGYQDDRWRLLGIRYSNVTDRGLCFDKNVWFTDLTAYDDWLIESFE